MFIFNSTVSVFYKRRNKLPWLRKPGGESKWHNTTLLHPLKGLILSPSCKKNEQFFIIKLWSSWKRGTFLLKDWCVILFSNNIALWYCFTVKCCILRRGIMTQSMQNLYCFSFLAIESRNFDVSRMAVQYNCIFLKSTSG